MVKSLKRNIHVYQLKNNSPSHLDLDEIHNKFLEKNLKNNIVEIDNENYLLVIFKRDNNFLSGAFIKLKDVSPIMIERTKSILDFFRYRKDQDPGEMSNFLWDFDNDIIIGEFNWDGARYLSCKLPKYIKKSYTKDIALTPIPYEETYKTLFLKNKIVKKMILKVPKPNVNLVNDVYGMDVKEMKKYVENDDDLEIEIKINRKTLKKGLIKEQLLWAYDKLKRFSGQEDVKLSVQDNSGEKVNLLEDVYMKYSIEFDMDEKTRTINRDDFFNKIKRFWLDNRSDILSIVQNA